MTLLLHIKDSYWDDGAIVYPTGDRVSVLNVRSALDGSLHPMLSSSDGLTHVTDALAVIRATGLDAVWDAAIKLKQARNGHVFQLNDDSLDILLRCVDNVCASVEAASEKEPDHA